MPLAVAAPNAASVFKPFCGCCGTLLDRGTVNSRVPISPNGSTEFGERRTVA